MRLLTDNLSPAQRDQLALFSYFDAIGGDTGTRYCIRYGNLMNVEQLESRGKSMRLLCFASSAARASPSIASRLVHS